jgi:DNA-binding FadR family transcriptional regulator
LNADTKFEGLLHLDARTATRSGGASDRFAGDYSPTPVRRGSIIHQAAEEICRLIEGRRLRAGDRLPPETALSEMLALSRNSVREAIRMLHGLGVVEKSTGRGAVVTAASTASWGIIDDAALIEASEVANEVRILTMKKCVTLAAKRLTAAELDRLRQEFAALEAASASGDRQAAKHAHDTFYGIVLAGARNALLVSIFKQADSARLTTLSLPADKTFVAEEHLEDHRALLEALLKRDGAAAAQAAQRHYLGLGRLIKLVVAQSAHATPGDRARAKGSKGKMQKASR